MSFTEKAGIVQFYGKLNNSVNHFEFDFKVNCMNNKNKKGNINQNIKYKLLVQYTHQIYLLKNYKIKYQ